MPRLTMPGLVYHITSVSRIFMFYIYNLFIEIIALLFFAFPYVSSSSCICSTPLLLAGYDVIGLYVYGSLCLYNLLRRGS